MAAIYRTFLKGLLALLPFAITLYLLVWIVASAETAVSGPLQSWFPRSLYFPGAGVVVVVLLILLFGFLVNNYLAQKLFDWFERKVEKLPIVRSIYSPVRDVTKLFSGSAGSGSQRVVMVQLLDNGPELLGLVTRDQFSDLPLGTVKDSSVSVFLPFSYGMGGMTVVVAKTRIRETQLTAERAMQLAITGWIKN